MLLLVLFAVLLGAVVGSFLNVVIYRLPRHESIVLPPSHCPHCQHRLAPQDLIPIVSWVALRGRCRYCQAPISARYPFVEGLSALAFGLLAWWKPSFPLLPLLWAFAALLIALAFIDLDTLELPDLLTYGGLGLALLASLAKLPRPFQDTLNGALFSAGLLALIHVYGGLIARRGRDATREFPVDTSQIALAAAGGAWLGPAGGLVLGLLNWALNWRTGRVHALPDRWALVLALLGLMVSWIPHWPIHPQTSLEGWLIGAGGLALLGGLYWAFHPGTGEEGVQVLGFGDVKLGGMLGAWLGFGPFVVALFVAVLLGALVGVLFHLKRLPFGPFLALGGFFALMLGSQIVQWYLAFSGLT